MFKKKDTLYTRNPMQASLEALAVLSHDPKWSRNWDEFCNQMVYEENKPTYLDAMETLRGMSREIFLAV